MEPNFIVELDKVPPDIESKLWRIDKFINKTTYSRMMSALQSFCESGTEVTSLFGKLAPALHSEKEEVMEEGDEVVLNSQLPSLEYANLNESQIRAISIGFSSRLTLIQGKYFSSDPLNYLIRSSRNRENTDFGTTVEVLG